MARAMMNSSKLTFQQCLHGYADGHRLLASSQHVGKNDAKTMLIMSDASGPGVVVDKSGYLTGYPLIESGYYALARTWMAPEVGRPGCVWTHTLLIDLKSIQYIQCPNVLNSLFRFPQKINEYSFYEIEVEFDAHNLSKSLKRIDDLELHVAKKILWALYKHPSQKVVASADVVSEELILNLWAQQWPYLKKTFRFCTLSFSDRSTGTTAFDLQLIPMRERVVRPRFPKVIDIEKIQFSDEAWLRSSALDLTSLDSGSLTLFFSNVGRDLNCGREAFIPLCTLRELIQGFPNTLDAAIELLKKEYILGSSDSVIAEVTTAIAEHKADVSTKALIFFMDNAVLLSNEEVGNIGVEIAKSLWYRDPQSFCKLFSQDLPKPMIAQRVLDNMPIDDLVKVVSENPIIIEGVIEKVPNLLVEPSIWTISGAWIDKAFSILEKNSHQLNEALFAMVQSNQEELASVSARHFGSTAILSTLETVVTENETISESTITWLDTSISNGRDLSEFFLSGGVKKRRILYLISQRTSPEFVSRDVDHCDPWLKVIQSTEDDLKSNEREYLYSYLLARAFGYSSKSSGELIGIAFDTVHLALLNSDLSQEAWSVLSPKLPKTAWWRDWDRCHRLRIAVANIFLNRNLSTELFVSITKDDMIFAEIVDLVNSQSYKGHRYIQKIKQVKFELSLTRRKILDKY